MFNDVWHQNDENLQTCHYLSILSSELQLVFLGQVHSQNRWLSGATRRTNALSNNSFSYPQRRKIMPMTHESTVKPEVVSTGRSRRPVPVFLGWPLLKNPNRVGDSADVWEPGIVTDCRTHTYMFYLYMWWYMWYCIFIYIYNMIDYVVYIVWCYMSHVRFRDVM